MEGRNLILALSFGVVVAALFNQPKKKSRKRHVSPENAFRLSGVEILVVQDPSQVEAIDRFLDRLALDEYQVLGLDAEWKPGSKDGKNKVALLQLANSCQCLLIQLHYFSELPSRLVDVLQDPSIVKAGVGIINDARSIWADHRITVRGCVELQSLAHEYGADEEGGGLASLASFILKVDLDKSYYLRCSDWEAKMLSCEQIEYAAADAWIGRQIMLALYLKFGGNDSDPLHFGSAFIDRKPLEYKVKQRSGPVLAKEVNLTHIPIRKTELYENCRMLSPEGVLLCTCNKKKLEWYLKRDIATLVCEDPPTIQLKFRPRGEGHRDDDYYLSEKQNKCVVCGADQNYVRHSVVPHSYRKHFPEIYKSRSSHDIILLCQTCLTKLNAANSRMKDQIAADFGISLLGSGPKVIVDPVIAKAVVNAKTMVKIFRGKVPEERKRAVEASLREYLGKDESYILTEEEVLRIMQLESKKEDPSYQSHEEMVVATMRHETQFQLFVNRWREHFLNCMRPQHLPQHWDPYRSISKP